MMAAHSSDSGLVLKAFSDVPNTLQFILDTLITRLARANRSDEGPDEVTRRALMKHVFSDGWDTTCPNVPPPNTPNPHPADGYAVYMGTFTQDLPPVVAAVHTQPAFTILTGFWGQTAGPPQPTVPNHRLAGAPAYLRVRRSPNDSFGLVFEVVDEQGDLANVNTNTSTLTSLSSNYKGVLLDVEFDTIRDARAKAMLRVDSAEIYTMSLYNLQWIIYWARNRLLKACELLSGLTPKEASYVGWETGVGLGPGPRLAYRMVGRNPPVDERAVVRSIDEDYNKLQKIVTCSEIIQELAGIEVLERRLGARMRRVLRDSGL